MNESIDDLIGHIPKPTIVDSSTNTIENSSTTNLNSLDDAPDKKSDNEKAKLNELVNFDPLSSEVSINSPSDISDIYDIKNPIRVKECLRLHKGNVAVQGTIVGISRLYKMIKSVTIKCENCHFVVTYTI